MKTDRLIDSLTALSRAATGPFDVEEILRQLADAAAEVLVVDGVGVMVHEDTEIRLVHARGETVEQVARLREVLQDGPCRDAADRMEEVMVVDLRGEGVGHPRWPAYAPVAVDIGIRSMVAVPILARDRAWGVLGAYRREATAWTDDQRRVMRLLADVAAAFLVMAVDRAGAERVRAELEHRTMHDELTGLANRALLFDRIDHAVGRAQRSGAAVAVLFIDLDDFKQINDTFGHRAGDVVLRTIAERMSGSLRDGDTLGRLAGDEFVLVCEDLDGHADGPLDPRVAAVIDRLQTVLTPPIQVGGRELVVSASIGVSMSSDGARADELVAEADAAMYGEKQHRNGTRPHRVSLASDRGRDRELRHALSLALEHDELRIHYQPIVTVGDREVVAVEALLRWQHPDLGLLPARTFVEVAEASGAIGTLGRWVVGRVCAQLASWRAELGALAPATANVNLGARELIDPTLAPFIAETLATHGLGPADLGIETGEGSFVHPLLVPVLEEYRHRGHPLTIDDLGQGLCPLARLVELPVSTVKVEGSYLHGPPVDTRRALVDAVVAVARRLDLQVIGSEVETPEQARALAEAGCTLLQGFHVGRPFPGDEWRARWRGEHRVERSEDQVAWRSSMR